MSYGFQNRLVAEKIDEAESNGRAEWRLAQDLVYVSESIGNVIIPRGFTTDMASVPRLKGDQELEFITGQPPSLINPPTGCRFAARCPKRFEKCSEEPPVISKDGRLVKCWLYT